MRAIYSTENSTKAHMIAHMLESNGIMVQVNGEYLRGALPHLSEGRSITLSVIDDEAEEARDLLIKWKEETEEENHTTENEEPTKPTSYLIPGINKEVIQWVIFSASLIWLLYSGLK